MASSLRYTHEGSKGQGGRQSFSSSPPEPSKTGPGTSGLTGWWARISAKRWNEEDKSAMEPGCFQNSWETTSNKSRMRWRILWAQNRCGMRSGDFSTKTYHTFRIWPMDTPNPMQGYFCRPKYPWLQGGEPPFSVYDKVGDIYVEHYSMTASHHFRQDICVLSRGWLLKYRGMFLWVSWNFLRLQAQGLQNE